MKRSADNTLVAVIISVSNCLNHSSCTTLHYTALPPLYRRANMPLDHANSSLAVCPQLQSAASDRTRQARARRIRRPRSAHRLACMRKKFDRGCELNVGYVRVGYLDFCSSDQVARLPGKQGSFPRGRQAHEGEVSVLRQPRESCPKLRASYACC